MIYYLNSLPGGMTFNSTWNGTQTQYNALSSYDDNTLYIIQDKPRVLTSMYMGAKKIYPIDSSDYDFIYEYIDCYSDIDIDTSIQLFSTENASRNWVFEIEFENNRATSGGEHAVIGSSSNSDVPAIELYCTGSNQNMTLFYRRIDGTTSSHDVSIGNVNGKKITIRKENGVCSLYIDDVLHSSFNWSVVNNTTNHLYIGAYRQNYYRWDGLIYKTTFKWLS